MSDIIQTETPHTRALTPTHARAPMSHAASLQILAELRRRLWLSDEAELCAESRALYQHIEKTLITALGEYYGESKQTDTRINRDNINEP